MVFKRKSFRRGRGRFRRRAKVSRPMRSFVHRVIDKSNEQKLNTWTASTTFASISTTPTELNFASLNQGTDIINRIGRKIKVLSVQLRAVMAAGASQVALDDPYNVIRVVLATWSGNTTTPLTSASATVSSVIDSRNGFQLMRRKYVDKMVPLSVASTEKGAGDGYVPKMTMLKFFKRFKNLYITYSDAGATSCTKTLVLSMLSDSSAAPHPGCIAGYVRFTFTDA